MLIDYYLPEYDVRARYETLVSASLSRVYETARNLNLRGSWIIRLLFFLRGLPEASLTWEGMQQWGFVLLAEAPEREIVQGLVGRFWVRSPQIESITPEAFRDFNRPGTSKAAMNLAFFQQPEGMVRVITETRVFCPDNASRLSFHRYWRVIKPFSGLIRREWLRQIRNQSENPSGS